MKKLIFVLIVLLSISYTNFAQDKKPERMRPALVVIDIQNKFLPMMDEREKEFALYLIKAYVAAFHDRGFPVIAVYHTDKDYGLVPGTPEFEFPEDIGILPGDAKVTKTYGNSFNKTDLEKILKEKNVNTVFLCGLSSVGCVLATWFGAKDLDLKAFMLKDAIMSHNEEYTGNVETIFSAIDDSALEVMLDNAE